VLLVYPRGLGAVTQVGAEELTFASRTSIEEEISPLNRRHY
jgi:hypothetical protein